jgi:hypothetical protein
MCMLGGTVILTAIVSGHLPIVGAPRFIGSGGLFPTEVVRYFAMIWWVRHRSMCRPPGTWKRLEIDGALGGGLRFDLSRRQLWWRCRSMF